MANTGTSMNLRTKRGPLTDISNQNSNINEDQNNSRPKRARKSIGVNSESHDDIPPPSLKITTTATTTTIKESRVSLESTSNKSTRTTRSSVSSSAGKSLNASASSKPVKTHIIKRSRPLSLKNQDPALCLDIIDDMYAIYYEEEAKYATKPYMPRQKDISNKMRSILVDWLIEVHYKFRLQPPTLWLSVNILDRYLSKSQVLRSKLQLVGVTALLIACKFEEVFPPEVSDCVYITDNAYDKAEILGMEITILTTLDFIVCIPTGYHFLNRFLNAIQASDRTRFLASFYAERNLQEADMLEYAPHEFAAASLYAALKQQSCQYACLRKASPWHSILQEESGLQEVDIIDTARNIVKHVSEEVETASRRRLIAAKKKYTSDKYQNITALDLPII